MTTKLTEEITDFLIKRYNDLFSFYNISTSEIANKLSLEVERKFGKRVKLLPQHLNQLFSSRVSGGTYLHEFFNCMVGEFKKENKGRISKEHPDYLLIKISRFIENDYGFGGKLSIHERYVLSDVLDKREDIAFTKSGRSYVKGRSKGKPGYFR